MSQLAVVKYNLLNLLSLKKLGLLFAVLGYLAVITFVPLDTGLTVVGQRVLAILVFAVIIWMTEAMDYSVSAIVIASMMVFFIGTAPQPDNVGAMIGSDKALKIATEGFAAPATVLVASALVLAAAMTKTGLDRRLALNILSLVGTKTRNIFLGTILVGILLAFMVPSSTARCSCLVPIILGIVAAFGMDKKSRFCGLLMISMPNIVTLWNVGVPTAGAQNLIALGFLKDVFKVQLGWLEWVKIAFPYTISCTVALYFLMLWMVKPEVNDIQGGNETIKSDLAGLGPMSFDEKKLLFGFVGLLFLWSTQGLLHHFDTPAVTLFGVALMLLPGIGIMTWKEVQNRIPWGTLILFGVSISLGNAMLNTKSAAWLAQIISATLGLESYSALAIVMVLGLFLLIIHLGFASASALTASMIPILISIFQGLPQITNPMGVTLLMQFFISLGFILPVNSPQSMVAYGTESFTIKDFMRVGIALTIVVYVLSFVFSLTYWKWLGIL